MKKVYILLTILYISSISIAQTQVDFNPIADVWVEELNPNTNYGGDELYIGRDPGGEGNNTLIKWDISSLPSNIIINSAEIDIWQWASSQGANPGGLIKRITEPWNESSTTWSNQPTTSSSYGTAYFTDISSSDWYVMDYSAITDLVNDWLTYGNYGVMFQANTIGTGYQTFDSKEKTHAPILKIFYTITSISENLVHEFKIYPNPVFNKLSIEMQNRQDVNLNIYNSLGQKTFTAKIETKNKTIDLSKLPSGLYLVEIKDISGNVLLTKKIIKK